MKMINTLLGKLCLIIFLMLTICKVQALEISGAFTLSSSVTISQTTSVTLSLINTDTGIGVFDTATLSPGDNSGNFFHTFSFPTLPDGDGSGSWELNYFCDKGTTPAGCDDIVADGHYSTDVSAVNTTTYDYNLRTGLSDTVNSTGLSFAIYPGKPMTGMIGTPSGVTATQDTTVKISAIPLSEVGGIITSQSTDVVILNGASQATYKVTLPDNNAETFRVTYICFSFNPGCEPYVQTGYFDNSSNGNTSASISDADIFDNSSTYSNILMRLIAAETLSGTITLDAVAPVGGLRITVNARNLTNNNTIAATVDFADGETSKLYSVPIPPDAVDWVLIFDCVTEIACADYVDRAYYNSSATNDLVYSEGDAEEITGGASVSNLDVYYEGSPHISGALSLSQGVAPVGGLEFLISALDPIKLIRIDGTFIMDEGESTLTYDIVVPLDSTLNWRMEYDCRESSTPLCSEVTDRGYYDASSGNTIEDELLASTLLGGLNHANIDFRVPSTFPDLSSFCVPVITDNGIAVICL